MERDDEQYATDAGLVFDNYCKERGLSERDRCQLALNVSKELETWCGMTEAALSERRAA